MVEWSKFYDYLPEGGLHRKTSNNQHRHVGSINSCGYFQFEHFGKTFMLHRAIYEMHNGKIPEGFYIDHIDRNPLNNKIENLRLASKSESKINTRTPRNNTTGYKGVLRTPNGKFQARLGFNGKKLYLGLFNTAEEASECVYLKTL
jgi:hypothetical protein